MIPDRLSGKQKLMFVPKQIEQICMIHLSPALFFCSKNTCQQYTYLCDKCYRENIHNHTDQIYDYPVWVQKMTEKISKLRTSNNRIFQSVYSEGSKNDFKMFVVELRRVLEIVQNLQVKLSEMIRESKFKIIGYIRKYQTYGQSKLSTKGYLYANPFLFITKVNSELNDEFVQDLKKCFKGNSTEVIDGFNPKYEVINLQNKLKKLLQGNHSELFSLNKQIARQPTIQPLQQRVIIPQNRPEKVFMKNDTLLVGLKNQTHIYRLRNSQMIEDKLAVNFSKYSSITVQGNINLIAINRESNRDLISYINRKLSSFTFQFRIYSILLYLHNNKYYSIIGRDEGKLTIFNIQTTQILATLQQAHNSKIQFLQPWQSEMKILSSGKNTPISIYKVNHLIDQITLQFQQQLVVSMGEMKQFQIYGTFFIALFQGKNILVHDLMLKIQYKNISNQQCKDFDMISLLFDNENYLVFATHNEIENNICLWMIEKKKPQLIRCQRLYLFEKQQINILEMSGNQLWLTRSIQNERRLYNFNLQAI